MSQARRLARLPFAIAMVAGCVSQEGALTGTQSLRIELVAPTTTGTVDARLPDTQRALSVNVTAIDARGEVDTSFEDPIRVYAQFLGTLTPDLNQMPLSTIAMKAGQATNWQIMLPGVFGPTTVWFDNGTGLGAEYVHGAVTGSTDTLWYRDPFIEDLQRPRDEKAVDALTRTPLTDKQIGVSTSRHGAPGRLVVTSIFSQGYTVADVQCADDMGAPPCTAGDYDHAMVFTFSAPRDNFGRALQQGQLIARFNGGLSEFNGLTEIGFPRTFIPETDPEQPVSVDPARLPSPALFDVTWFGPLTDDTGMLNEAGMINFERNEAGPIEIRGAKVCNPDDDFDTYKQWKLDPSGMGGNCKGRRNVLNVISAGTDFTTDPRTLAGRTLTRVVGILRPVNIGSFNVWIIYPRGTADISL